jgi:hypothetical protein
MSMSAVVGEQKPEEFIFTVMPERPHCAHCGKDAIGGQSFGCRRTFVCEDHAHSILRTLAPGRNYSSGDCSFERFGASGTQPPKDEGSLPPDCG